MLGLGSAISKSNAAKRKNDRIITDNLILRQSFSSNSLQRISTGAADINRTTVDNSHINVGAITIGTGDISVSAWVYMAGSSFVNYGGIFTNREEGGSQPGIGIRTRNTNKIECIIDDGGTSVSSESGVLNVHEWYHVCAVWDRSGSQYLYIDGVLADSDTITGAASTLNHSDSALIGRRFYDGTSQYFQGFICNVGYWNRTLSQAEIKSIMYKGYEDLSIGEKHKMAHWWSLDTAYDSNDGAKEITLDNHYAGNASSEGSELITNGNFSTGDLTGWSTSVAGDGVTPVYTTVNGTPGVRISSVSGGNSLIYQGVMTSGKFYNISYTILENNNGELSLEDDSSDPIPSTVGDHSIKYYFVDSDSSFVLKRRTGATDIVVTNISVKEINGNTGILL